MGIMNTKNVGNKTNDTSVNSELYKRKKTLKDSFKDRFVEMKDRWYNKVTVYKNKARRVLL